MLGVGPGALVGDAYRMGIDPEQQRRMMNESLDVIVKLLDGETVTMKSDWFEVKDAHVQIPPFTVPRTEMAVACAFALGGACGGQARHRHAVDWWDERRGAEAPRQ